MSSQVLIIDPSLTTRKILEVSLRRAAGLACICFSTGEDALRALASAPELSLALIVLEIRLPGIDGLRIIRLLRSSARYDQTPIIVLTEHDSVSHRLLARLAGANRYLAKPFVRQAFEGSISALVERNSSRNANGTRSGGYHEQQYSNKSLHHRATGGATPRAIEANRSRR